MSESPYIFDISGAANFEQLVIENSFHKPVLVDFWAEWCAPCKALMPMLAKITEEYAGELLLAKINCDIEQDIVMRFGIRSLPTVVLFKDGQPVDGFAGAQPEAAIREMLKPHVAEPAPAGFHARFSATWRRYRYRIINRRAPPALDRFRVWHVAPPLDVAAMRDGAAHLIGHHDFSTFRDSLCQARSPLRTLDGLDVTRDGDEMRSAPLNRLARAGRNHPSIPTGRWA